MMIYRLLFCFCLCILTGCSEKDIVTQALTYDEQGNYEKAITYWSKAIDMNPHDARYYINRGADKHELEDYTGAIEDCNMALQIDSSLMYGYISRAGNKYALKDYEGALKDYNTALNIYLFRTKKSRITLPSGTAIFPLKNPAITNDDLMEEPQYQMTQILIDRGQAYYQLDSLNLALNDFTACIEGKFCLSFCFYWRACIYYKMGNINKAYDDLKQVLLYEDKNSEMAKHVQEVLDKGIHVLNTKLKFQP